MPFTVRPQQFDMVDFDAARIVEIGERVAAAAGFPADAEIVVQIDERTPLGRTRLASTDPVTIEVEGGAFEDAKRIRHMSDRSVESVLARHLFRAHDRIAGGFADAPADDDLTLQQTVAWDAYAVGRAARAGLAASQPRRLYHFRTRHGFTDVADAVFERLWNADQLTWADIEAACAETDAARQSAPAG